MAPIVPAGHTKNDVRYGESVRLGPLDGDEITLSARVWEIVLALGESDVLDDILDILEIDEADAVDRLAELDALGVLDVVGDGEPEPIAVGGLGQLVGDNQVDVDTDEYFREDRLKFIPTKEPCYDAPVARDPNGSDDDDTTTALVFRFLGNAEH